MIYLNTYVYCFLSSSIAVHPGKVIVASGQVAGHDKDEGKVGLPSTKTF